MLSKKKRIITIIKFVLITQCLSVWATFLFVADIFTSKKIDITVGRMDIHSFGDKLYNKLSPCILRLFLYRQIYKLISTFLMPYILEWLTLKFQTKNFVIFCRKTVQLQFLFRRVPFYMICFMPLPITSI
jgi:hypothetical protein